MSGAHHHHPASGDHAPGTHHPDPTDPLQRKIALAMAVYAIVLAFDTMLTNRARTEELLQATEAADQWTYYQAKSVKSIVNRSELELLTFLAPAEPKLASAAKDRPPTIGELRSRLGSEADRYEKEKQDLLQVAKRAEEERDRQKRRESGFEVSCTVMELGIVVATVALLLANNRVYWASAAFAAGSLTWTVLTALR